MRSIDAAGALYATTWTAPSPGAPPVLTLDKIVPLPGEGGTQTLLSKAQLTFPLQNQGVGQPFQFRWNTVPNAQGYVLRILGSSGTLQTREISGGGTVSTDAGSLLEDTYEATIQACGTSFRTIDCGPASDLVRFSNRYGLANDYRAGTRLHGDAVHDQSALGRRTRRDVLRIDAISERSSLRHGPFPRIHPEHTLYDAERQLPDGAQRCGGGVPRPVGTGTYGNSGRDFGQRDRREFLDHRVHNGTRCRFVSGASGATGNWSGRRSADRGRQDGFIGAGDAECSHGRRVRAGEGLQCRWLRPDQRRVSSHRAGAESLGARTGLARGGDGGERTGGHVRVEPHPW